MRPFAVTQERHDGGLSSQGKVIPPVNAMLAKDRLFSFVERARGPVGVVEN